MKKGFKSKRLMAILMAALISVNSLPVTALAGETDVTEQNQLESVMESETAEDTIDEDIEETFISEEEMAEETEEAASEEQTIAESEDAVSKEETGEEEKDEVLSEEEYQTEKEIIDSGTCGENVTWTLDSEGLLVISGTGEMTDYTWRDEAPWGSKKENILSVIIENGVASIGAYAFYECANIESVEIPDSVTSIGRDAFYHCESLISLFIKENIQSIGAEAFSGRKLTVMYASKDHAEEPSGVVSASKCDDVRSYGITDEGQFYCIRNDNTAVVTKYLGSETQVTIPETVENYPVTEIAKAAYYRTNLTEVIIPDSVEKIGYWAFTDCQNIKGIYIPESVQFIGNYAFDDNRQMLIMFESDVLPEIGSEAWNRDFWNRYADCVMSVDRYGIADGEYYYCITKNNEATIGVYYGSEKNVEIPEQIQGAPVVEISGTFASNEYLESVKLPESLTKIGKNTFYYCKNLNNVDIPQNVVNISDYAFYYCQNMNNIDIPQNVTNIGDYAFFECINIEKVIIPDKVKSIGDNAFCECEKLQSLKLGRNLSSIGHNSFNKCKLLSEIIYNSVQIQEEEVGRRVFDYAGQNTDGIHVIFSKNVQVIPYSLFNSEDEAPNITEVTFEEGGKCEKIGVRAFCYVSALESIEIPESVTLIGEGAFKCSGVKKIKFKSSAPTFGYDCFTDVVAEVYYPMNDASWTEDVRQNYGGTLTWIGYEKKKLDIIQQPVDVEGSIGDTAVFAVEADGDDVTYQWQYCNSGSNSWADSKMTGANTEKLEVKITKGRIGQKYRCILKDGYGKKLTTEEAIIIQAEEKELTITQQPKSVEGKVGDTAVFTVGAEGNGIIYQWQYCNNASDTWTNSRTTGANTDKLEVKVTKGRIGQKYRCILRDSRGNRLTTEEVQITQAEDKELTITQQPENVSGKVGDTASFTVGAEGDGIVCQWQYCNKDSNVWANSKMTGYNTNSIDVKITKGRIGQKYRCILRDSRGNRLTTEEVQIMQAEN